MKLKNNIKAILEEKNISINKLATELERGYRIIWDTVNRDTLNTTTLETLVEISKVLGVGITDLYKENNE